jgi:hypothetical protein
VFNATFNNISAISWRPVLVVEEAGVPGENAGKHCVQFSLLMVELFNIYYIELSKICAVGMLKDPPQFYFASRISTKFIHCTRSTRHEKTPTVAVTLDELCRNS